MEYDKDKFKIRRKIENFFVILKENKRLALRYEKSDLTLLSFVALAVIKYNLMTLKTESGYIYFYLILLKKMIVLKII